LTVVIVQDGFFVPCLWLDLDELTSLYRSIPVSNDIHLIFVDDASMSIIRWWLRLNLLETVVACIQHILPIVRAVVTTGWAPLDKKQITCCRIVARGFV
jgi:hypothetical protein